MKYLSKELIEKLEKSQRVCLNGKTQFDCIERGFNKIKTDYRLGDDWVFLYKLFYLNNKFFSGFPEKKAVYEDMKNMKVFKNKSHVCYEPGAFVRIFTEAKKKYKNNKDCCDDFGETVIDECFSHSSFVKNIKC